MDLVEIQQKVDRLLSLIYAWIAFIPEFFSTTPGDVTVTFTGESGAPVVRTHPNLQKIIDTVDAKHKMQIGFDNIQDIKNRSSSIQKYIVSGDSTRDNIYNEAMYYYRSLLNNAGIDFYDNSRSGQTLTDWVNNTDSPNINEAISEIAGTGAGTLLELSLGLNDWGIDNSKQYLVQKLTEGVERLLSAKPDLTILLVTTIPTSNTTRQNVYLDAYKEVAAQKGLPLLSTIPVFSGDQGIFTRVYNDGTHPNSVGMRRLVNYILNNVFDPTILQKMAMGWVDVRTPLDITPDPFLVIGKWINAEGNESNNDDAVCSTILPSSYGSSYEIYHGGERGEVYFYDKNMTMIGSVIVYGEDEDGKEIASIPKKFFAGIQGTKFMRFNVTLSGEYDEQSSYIKRVMHTDTGIPLLGETTVVIQENTESLLRYLLGGDVVLRKTSREALEIRANETLDGGAGINIYTAKHPTRAFWIKLYIQSLLGGQLILSGLPESDPGEQGSIWNDGGTIKISNG